MPKISIIMPVYNVENYLENSIKSVLNQTFTDIELILVNDGSTDSSLEICKYYGNRDSRIHIIDKTNGGLSSSRNAGLDVAKGEYIGFIDSDDYIHPQMYEVLYDEIIKYNSDLSICNFEKVYNHDEKLLKSKLQTKEDSKVLSNIEALHQLRGENAIIFTVSWNKLYKKNIFDDLRFELGFIHEDEFIIHRILYSAKTVVYKNINLYFYLQREGSIMKSKSEIDKVYYLLALNDRVHFLYKIGLQKLLYEWEDVYLYEFMKVYPKLRDIGYGHVNLLKLRCKFFSLMNILWKNKSYTKKMKISLSIFCISPYLYDKLGKNKKFSQKGI